MSQASGDDAEVIVTASPAVQAALDQLGDLGEALKRPLATYLHVERLEKHSVLFIGHPHGQVGNLLFSTPAQKIERYRSVAYELVQLAEDDALGVNDGANGESATRVGSALMAVHMELQAPAPATVVIPPAAGAAAPAASEDRSTAPESKTMSMTRVNELLSAAAVIYQRRWGTEHLPPCRFMNSIAKCILRVEKREDGSDAVTWYAYPTQNDATKLTHAKSTMLATMSTTAPIATMHLGRGINNEAEFQEREGEILKVESAKVDEIVDCYHRKLMPIILLSAAYPLPAGCGRVGMASSRLPGGQHVMLSLDAASSMCDALRRTKESDISPEQLLHLLDGIESELTRLTSTAENLTYSAAMQMQISTVNQASMSLRLANAPRRSKEPAPKKKRYAAKTGGNDDNPVACKDYQKGQCKRDKCSFKHSK